MDATDHENAPPPAPTSPRIKRWNRLIATYGALPLLMAGLLASYVPDHTATLSIVGAAGLVLFLLPAAVFAFRLRRDNARRFLSAWAEAEATGQRVKTVTAPSGDNKYELYAPEVLEPIDWEALR
jgi:hypothetical protein